MVVNMIGALMVGTSMKDARKAEAMAHKLITFATGILALDGVMPACTAEYGCNNLERYRVSIPLPTYNSTLGVVGAERPPLYCGIKRHTIMYSAATRFFVIMPFVLNLTARYNHLLKIDYDVHILRMPPIPVNKFDLLHTGLTSESEACSFHLNEWYQKYTNTSTELPAWVVYSNFLMLNTTFIDRYKSFAYAWYQDVESWNYRWTDQQFWTSVIRHFKATVMDCSSWRMNQFFIHNMESIHHIRRFKRYDKTHIACDAEGENLNSRYQQKIPYREIVKNDP